MTNDEEATFRPAEPTNNGFGGTPAESEWNPAIDPFLPPSVEDLPTRRSLRDGRKRKGTKVSRPKTARIPKETKEPKTRKARAPKAATINKTEKVEKASSSPIVKKKTLILAIAISAVVSLGIGAGVYALVADKPGVISEDSSVAMSSPAVPGLPDGVTGMQVLSIDRLEDASKEVNDTASTIAKALTPIVGEFDTFLGSPNVITSRTGEETPLFSAASDTHFINKDFTVEDRRKVLDAVNAVAMPLGFPEFVVGGEETDSDPYDAVQFFVGSTMIDKNGKSISYNVVVNKEDAESNIVGGIYVTVFSSPHIKVGTESDFEKYVVDSFNTIN